MEFSDISMNIISRFQIGIVYLVARRWAMETDMYIKMAYQSVCVICLLSVW